MNLNQLHYFVTLAHIEHYTRAAEMLSITQPSLSHAISMLEQELERVTVLLVDSPYKAALSHMMVRISAALTYTEMLKPTWRISPDALFGGLISLGSIVLVLNYEKLDIVRSKAFSLIPKGRA